VVPFVEKREVAVTVGLGPDPLFYHMQVDANGVETYPFISKAVEELAGYSVEEIQAKPGKAWVLITPEEGQRLKEGVSFAWHSLTARTSAFWMRRKGDHLEGYSLIVVGHSETSN
jgi:hypothetical protein